jgi:hypothetical protein
MLQQTLNSKGGRRVGSQEEILLRFSPSFNFPRHRTLHKASGKIIPRICRNSCLRPKRGGLRGSWALQQTVEQMPH